MGKHFIATIDTGGITYSGRYIVALGAGPREARLAAVREVKKGRASLPIVGHKPLRTVADFEDWFGIRVYGPIADGEAVSE